MALWETASKSAWGRIPREVMFELTHKGCARERHVEKRVNAMLGRGSRDKEV